MEEYLRWQIEQLKATVAKQDKIIRQYAKRELARKTKKKVK